MAGFTETVRLKADSTSETVPVDADTTSSERGVRLQPDLANLFYSIASTAARISAMCAARIDVPGPRAGSVKTSGDLFKAA